MLGTHSQNKTSCGEGEEIEDSQEDSLIATEDLWVSDMAVAISIWASKRSSSVKKRYLVKQVDDQDPDAIIWRIDPPTWYKKLAPPLLKLCPEYNEGSRLALDNKDLSLSVKSL